METPQTPASSSVKPVSLIPDGHIELSALITRVTKTWPTRPDLILIWTNVAAMTQLAADLADLVKTREDLSDNRSPVAQKIAAFDKKINKALTSVKGYINDKWEDDDEAEALYPVFGIDETSAGDMLPIAQRPRIAAIEKLMGALTTHGMAGVIKGTAFWQGILDAYKPLVEQSEAAAQSISASVGDKNPKLVRARLFLSRFNSLLEAQTETPEQYLALRREMGYLKEYN